MKKRFSITLEGNLEAKEALRMAEDGLNLATKGRYKVDPQMAFILGVSKLKKADYEELALKHRPTKIQRNSMVEEFNRVNGSNLSASQITDLLLKKSLENGSKEAAL